MRERMTRRTVVGGAIIGTGVPLAGCTGSEEMDAAEKMAPAEER